jgi:hypothetical protein
MISLARLTDVSQGWVDEQIEGFKIMLERNVRSFIRLSPTCPSRLIVSPHSQR